MSYPMELDEYPDETLRAELLRRDAARAEGRCGYCRRSAEAHTDAPCRFWKSREADKQRPCFSWKERQGDTFMCSAGRAGHAGDHLFGCDDAKESADE